MLKQSTQERRELRAVTAQRDQLALTLKAIMQAEQRGAIRLGPLAYLGELALRNAKVVQ